MESMPLFSHPITSGPPCPPSRDEVALPTFTDDPTFLAEDLSHVESSK